MRFIGITGGVGAGKSLVLSCLKEYEGCRVLLADEVANEIKLPGQPCYEALVRILGPEVLAEDGTIDKGKMAQIIFSDADMLARVNAVIHPAVKQYIMQEVEKERKKGELAFFFLEAALLIEEGYGELADELWYIHADEAVRIKRLMESRGYSEEKARSIMRSQLSEAKFRQHCRVTLENNGSPEEIRAQIAGLMEGCMHKK